MENNNDLIKENVVIIENSKTFKKLYDALQTETFLPKEETDNIEDYLDHASKIVKLLDLQSDIIIKRNKSNILLKSLKLVNNIIDKISKYCSLLPENDDNDLKDSLKLQKILIDNLKNLALIYKELGLSATESYSKIRSLEASIIKGEKSFADKEELISIQKFLETEMTN